MRTIDNTTGYAWFEVERIPEQRHRNRERVPPTGGNDTWTVPVVSPRGVTDVETVATDD